MQTAAAAETEDPQGCSSKPPAAAAALGEGPHTRAAAAAITTLYEGLGFRV